METTQTSASPRGQAAPPRNSWAGVPGGGGSTSCGARAGQPTTAKVCLTPRVIHAEVEKSCPGDSRPAAASLTCWALRRPNGAGVAGAASRSLWHLEGSSFRLTESDKGHQGHRGLLCLDGEK